MGYVPARKNFKHYVCSRGPNGLIGIDMSPDDAAADIGFEETIDRGGGSFRKRGSYVSWNQTLVFAVSEEGEEHDDGVARQSRDVCQQLAVCEVRPIDRLEFRIVVSLNGLARGVEPATIETIAPANHDKPTCAGLEALRQLQRLRRVVIVDHRGDAGRQPHGFVSRARYIGQYDGNARGDHVAILKKKRYSRNADHNDCVKAHTGVFLLQEVRHAQGVRHVWTPCQIEKISFDFESVRRLLERPAEGF